MKNLRNLIRRIILEDLGEKVFAKDAPVGHPHHGDEENTPEEQMLWSALNSYILYNTSDEMMDNFDELMIKYSSDPKYSDVLKTVDDGTKIYRGMLVDIEHISGFCLGGDAAEGGFLVEKGKSYGPSSFAPMEYEHADWRTQADQPISSWSPDMVTAVRFAQEGNPGNDENIVSAVFITSASKENGTFIDFRPLYAYNSLNIRSNEQEIAGFGHIQVEKVVILEI